MLKLCFCLLETKVAWQTTASAMAFPNGSIEVSMCERGLYLLRDGKSPQHPDTWNSNGILCIDRTLSGL